MATGCAAFATGVPDLNVPSTTHYDALGRAFEQVDVLGHVTRSSYDILGQTTATTRNYVSGGPVDSDTNISTSQSYDALGRVETQTDALGVITSQSYDALGRVVTATDGEQRLSRMGYDGSGAQRWSETPDGRFTVLLVDGLGRVTTTIQNYQDGVVGANEPIDQDLITHTVYDVAGRRVATIDAAGQETRFTYDLNDQLLTVTENTTDGACALAPCNVTTRYAYDRAGNRLSITDANGHTRSFAYDAADRQVSETDALNQVTAYQYDRLGRMTLKDDPRGSAYDVSYSYDGLDRPDGITATQLSGAISFGYDALGRRTSLTDGTGTTNFSYDDAGRITGVTAPNTGSVGYGYNANGQRMSLTYPDSSVIGYTYWADGQLKDVLQGTTTLAGYTYDPSGQLATVTRANGAVTSYGYDGADRLSDLSTLVGSTPVSAYHYTLNRQGLRTAVDETLVPTGTRTITYSYDGLSRLTGAVESGATSNSYAYTYDLAGNRTSATINGVMTSQNYNAANQVAGWSYDAAGNLLSDGTSTYTYDALGRTTSQGSTSYSYNGDGTLVAQTVGSTTTRYAQDLAAPLSQVLNDGSASYIYGLDRLRNNAGTWYLGDALGSLRQTLNASGAVLATASYDPWGTPQGSSIAPFGFTGELQDGAGQVYLRARWYTSRSGTFTSRDSFAGWPEQPYSLSYYQYGYSDPILNTDPSGQCVPYPVNPFDPDCKFIGWNPTQWNWADGREYYYGPPGTIGKLAAMALFPPAAFVYGAENAALSYIRYNDDPSTCNGVLAVVDTTLAILPFGSLAKFGGGAGPMMQGGVQVLTAAQSQLLRLEVAAVAVGAGYIPNVFFSKSGDGSGDPSGQGGNLKVPSEKFWKDRGIDPHEVKADYLGKRAELKLFDLAKDSDDMVWIVRKSRREGQFAPIKVLPLEDLIQIYGS